MNTPFLSIVVVTWNNENNIEQALHSCVFDGVTDYEVIVVHNASDDETGKYLRRVTDAHPGLFRIIENDKNEGLGIARNIGLAAAQGEFVMFLDGDDYYDSAALKRLLPLLRKRTPDVLVFNHARFWDSGGIHVNANTALLAERDVSTIAGRLEVLDNFNVAWNKVYKRSFLSELGVTFPHRIYEDIEWHFRILSRAKTYYAIPEVLVYYRQRSGSILRSRNEQHFDIIDQYEDVFAFLRSDPALFKIYGQPAYEHARKLMMNLLVSQARLPRSSERRYLARMNDLLARWRVETGQTNPGLMMRLAALGQPILLVAWQKAYYASQKVQRLLPRIKNRLRPPLYKLLSRILPVKQNKVIVEAYWGAKADCSPLSIANALKATGNFDIVWSFKSDAPVDPDFGFKSVDKSSFAFVYHLATAKYQVNNANFPTEFEKRRGVISLQTKHGTPLKTMGIDIRPINPREMNWGQFADRCRRWDYVISSNPYSTRVWRQGFPFHYKMLVMRGHYFNTPGESSAKIIDASAYPWSNDVALITDLLITDYSSIMFDYACLQRPIVLYPYDYKDYSESRGMYFDIRQKSPGAVVFNQTDLLDCLKSRAFDAPENQEKRQAFTNEFCPWDDGHATDRVLKAVFGV